MLPSTSRPSSATATRQARSATLGWLGLIGSLAIASLGLLACAQQPTQQQPQLPTQQPPVQQPTPQAPPPQPQQQPQPPHSPTPETAYVLRGKVFDVHDGDTIKVQLDSGPVDVRFHGSDSPELNQAHGPESRAALERLVGGREVELEPTGQFSYERMVAIVYVGDINVNEQMIKLGEAWAARKYLRKTKEAEWCSFENAARELRRGLWAQPPAEWIDPYEWRYRKKRNYKYTDYSQETTAECIAAIGKT